MHYCSNRNSAAFQPTCACRSFGLRPDPHYCLPCGNKHRTYRFVERDGRLLQLPRRRRVQCARATDRGQGLCVDSRFEQSEWVTQFARFCRGRRGRLATSTNRLTTSTNAENPPASGGPRNRWRDETQESLNRQPRHCLANNTVFGAGVTWWRLVV